MRTIAILVVLTWFVATSSRSRSDGLIHKLPPDGDWARFELEWLGPSPAGELTVLKKGTLTISSVGRAIAEGERCRWIEIRNASVTDDKEVVSIQKLLIPEKYLLAGLNPLGHVVKAWTMHPAINGGEPQEITDTKGEQARPIRALTDMFFGLPSEIRALEEEVLEAKGLGTLRCPGIAARYILKRGELESIFDYEVHLHERAPFGVVRFRSESIHKENGVVKVPKYVTVLRLADFGSDANSELADKK